MLLSDLYSIIEKIQLSTSFSVLATLVHVDGSSYRRTGAWMVMEETSITGMISGGCVEADLAERIGEIVRENKSVLFSYNLKKDDDLSWGFGTGCNGEIMVLLEPVNSHLRETISMLKKELDRGKNVWLVKKISDNGEVTDYFFQTDDGLTYGRWEGAIPESAALQNQGLRYYNEEKCFLYVQHISPKPQLIIFGAGPDARPLVELSCRIGFNVTVADWRPAYCNHHFFPHAFMTIVGSPVELMEKVNPSERDFIVLMTHSFQKDQELLGLLLDRKVKYLGLLGSKDRSDRLLRNFSFIPDWVYCPVGLPIGAEGPDEIAISILAEIISKKADTGNRVLLH